MIDFTLYPNLNGQLGQNKVQIPDGVTTFWPDGDALVGNFVYKNGKLVGFVDTKALISNDAKTTTIPYDYFNSEFENVRENSVKFNLGERCKYFTLKMMPKYKGCKTLSDVKNIDENYLENDIVDGVWSKELEDLEDGNKMFFENINIISFKLKLNSLINGNQMFQHCSNLITFESGLNSLKSGHAMFWGCKSLSSFTTNMKLMWLGNHMFRDCINLVTFKSEMDSLSNANSMFMGCGNLSSFVCEKLISLNEAPNMFAYCNNLTSFKSNLKSLTDAKWMFSGCKLDTNSIKNIAETINTVTDSNPIHIGIGNTTPTEEENSYLTQIHDKGWQVYVNGSSTAFAPADGTSLIPIDGEQNLNPIPFWAKPVPSDEESANYVDENGNFFNILGGQFIYVNDPETYGMFINEEDAAAQMRLTRIEKEEV